MSNSENITEKQYQKLTVQVASDGLNFCVTDTLNQRVVKVKEIIFNAFDKDTKTEELFANAFRENPELTSKYDEIIVLHYNNLSTFVPNALFDEEYLGSYLQYNTKVFESDFFAFDAIDNYEMKNVFIPYININNFFIDQFGTFHYKHSNTVLVTKLLELSKNIDDKIMFVSKNTTHFELVVLQNQKLLLFNSFEYKTPEDFIYYLLFTAEQLQMNPENFKLQLLGNIQESDEYFQIAYKYIRNVSLFDVSNFNFGYHLSETEKRKHFILFNS
jgi:hypothetical protein